MFIVVLGFLKVSNSYPDVINPAPGPEERVNRFLGFGDGHELNRKAVHRGGRDSDRSGIVAGQQIALLQELLRFVKRTNTQDYSLNAGGFGVDKADSRAGVEDESVVINLRRRRKKSAPFAPRIV